MIIDSISNVGLAIGTDRRSLEQSDAQLSVPNIRLPVLLALETHQGTPGASIVTRQSYLFTQVISRTNQAALSLGMGILGKGLWEMEMTLSSWFNFSTTVGANLGVELQLTYKNNTYDLLRRLALLNQTFTDFNRLRLLLEEDSQISVKAEITGVGQSLDAIATVNAIRVL
jgi:hypothetical protein